MRPEKVCRSFSSEEGSEKKEARRGSEFSAGTDGFSPKIVLNIASPLRYRLMPCNNSRIVH